ncbi:AfsR/SARP family transcriptional regulator [Amycolatopsis nigrescens]|uniref:AfsR/SARP family transcriptional regulator n=1 Tax=Amycolatopsis nigrescens TaxID=381445 RepID=UPI00247FCA9F|nr:AfsR/SARP family transcriptional regulator [Amycolatopsis nigrescens]
MGSTAVGGRRQPVVLAVLALEANRAVGVDQLIDSVWDSKPPPTARAQIQVCISNLRKLLKETGSSGRILTRPPGYLLAIAGDNLDYERFQELLALAHSYEGDGRLVDALIALRQALDLWRGPALADVESENVRRAAIIWDDRRLAAEIDRVRVELALGRHAELVADVQKLVGENPLREELCGYLMVALYRSGRQAEVLAVFRRTCDALIDDLGIEPSAELRDLARAMLNHDQRLRSPARLAGSAEYGYWA